ncbi:MAG: hypothetical protein Kow0031_09600 [Anaerolineae bacterium]
MDTRATFAFSSVLLIILEVTIVVVMLRIKSKSTATRFLIGFFVCVLFTNIAMVWSNLGPVHRALFIPTQDAFLIAGGIGLAGFAYYYPRNDQPAEARRVLAVFAIMATGAFIYNLYFAYDVIATSQPRSNPFPFVLLMPLALLLIILLFARRALHFADLPARPGPGIIAAAARALWRPPNRVSLAQRNFALAVAVGIIQAVASAGLVPEQWDVYFIAIGAILAISAIALVYLNHGPEPTSFMIKLVGISLVTLLVVLGINGINQINQRHQDQYRYIQIQAAAALQASEPAETIPDVRYIISWPDDASNDPANYQVHFRHPGESLAALNRIIAVNTAVPTINRPPEGLVLGRDPLPYPVSFERIVAAQIPHPGRIYEVGFLLEDYLWRPLIAELAWQIVLVVVSSLAIMLLFPLFFRRTLVTPLNNLLYGIGQANTGQLNITVPVIQNDELGQLTGSFNQMVGSLRQSQAELRNLTRDLDQRLTTRTQELSALLNLIMLPDQPGDETGLLQAALARVDSVGEFSAAVIHRFNEELSGLVPVTWFGLPDAVVQQMQSPGAQTRLAAWAINLENMVVAHDAAAAPNLPVELQVTRRPELAAYAGIPFALHGQPYGLLSVFHASEQRFSLDEVSILTALARQLSVLLENSRAQQQVRNIAILEERQRLARDMHDVVSQTLFSASIMAESLPDLWDKAPQTIPTQLHHLHHLNRGALAEMRSLLLELRPEALAKTGLDVLLKQLGYAAVGTTHLELTLDLQPDKGLPPDRKINLYRMAQEAVNNVVKHARASTLTLSLRFEPPPAAVVSLRVGDDGRGFDLAQVEPGRLGLKILQERAAAIGAHLRVESQPAQGTTVTVVCPLE